MTNDEVDRGDPNRDAANFHYDRGPLKKRWRRIQLIEENRRRRRERLEGEE